MSGSVIVSIIALAVSAYALENSMKQRKIASEAHRLNLYQRRFDVYDAVVQFANFRVHKPVFWDEELAARMRSAKVESDFLFDPKDKIPEIIEEISTKLNKGNNIDALVKLGVEQSINVLKLRFRKYLDFHEISQ